MVRTALLIREIEAWFARREMGFDCAELSRRRIILIISGWDLVPELSVWLTLNAPLTTAPATPRTMMTLAFFPPSTDI